MAIDRKIWKGDLLRLMKGNAFHGSDVVQIVRDGFAVASQDSEAEDPLVEIDGGAYVVKRSDLYELSESEAGQAHALATIQYAGLNGATPEELQQAAAALS